MTLQEPQEESQVTFTHTQLPSMMNHGANSSGIQLRLDIEDLLREYVALMQASAPITSTNSTMEQFFHQSNSPSHHSNLSNDIDNVYYCKTNPNNSVNVSEQQVTNTITLQQDIVQDREQQAKKGNSKRKSSVDDKPNYSKSKVGKTRRRKSKLPGESEFKLWTWIGEKSL